MCKCHEGKACKNPDEDAVPERIVVEEHNGDCSDCDDQHDEGAWKICDRHDERVLEDGLCAVVEAGQHREYVGQHDEVQKSGSGDDDPEYGPDSAGRLLYDQKIKHKHDAEQEHDQPDRGRLLEVLAERFEEGTGDVAIFIFRHLQSHVIHGGQGGSDREDWDAAHDKKDVQDHQIGQLSECTEKAIVHVEKITHLLNTHSLFFPAETCLFVLSHTYLRVSGEDPQYYFQYKGNVGKMQRKMRVFSAHHKLTSS